MLLVVVMLVMVMLVLLIVADPGISEARPPRPTAAKLRKGHSVQEC